MNKKLISIAGIIFALVFVGIFIYIWVSSSNLIRLQSDNINQLYKSDAPFDTALFDNKVVTGQSLQNFLIDVDSTPLLRNYKIYINGSEADSFGLTVQYRTYLHYNENGMIDGIEAVEMH